LMGDLLQSAFTNVSCIKTINPTEDAQHRLDVEAGASVDVILLGSSREDCDSNAVTVLRSLLVRYEKAKAIVLMHEPDHDESIALLRAGAKGIFCVKNFSFELLCKSVHCVYQGQIWLSNDLVKCLIDTVSRPQSREVTDFHGRKLLTAREQQVLHLLADGLSNSQLALELKLSEHTVKNHLFRIYEKLGVSNRMEAVLYALAPRHEQPAPFVIREVPSSTIRMVKAG
jgi:DNA-binding NarL/FixJ family response regulator